MEFKVDENLPVEVADLLRQVGYDAVPVLEQHLGGSPDPDIASVCQQEGRVLITLDTDFADIRAMFPCLSGHDVNQMPALDSRGAHDLPG